jgi:hypothetical protein
MFHNPRVRRALIWLGGGMLALDGLLASLYFEVRGFDTPIVHRWIVGLTIAWIICGIWWVMGKEKEPDKPVAPNPNLSKGIGEGQTAKSDSGNVKQFAVDLAGAKIETLNLGSDKIADVPPPTVPILHTPIEIGNPLKRKILYRSESGQWIKDESGQYSCLVTVKMPYPDGEDHGKLRRVSAHLEFSSFEGAFTQAVKNAYWLDEATYQLDFTSGDVRFVLVGLPEGESWIAYQNPSNTPISHNYFKAGLRDGWRELGEPFRIPKGNTVNGTLIILSSSIGDTQSKRLATSKFRILFDDAGGWIVLDGHI